MKKLNLLLCAFVYALSFVLMFSNFSAAEETKKEGAGEEDKLVSVSAGCAFSSIYWWRGLVLFDGAPAFSPSVEAGTGSFTFNVTSFISGNRITAEDSTTEKEAKSYCEIDYTAGYGLDFDAVSIGASLAYFQFPYYDEADEDATDPSQWEASVSLTANTILSPTAEFYYEYYTEKRQGEDGEDTPVNKDYYINFSVSHDVISTEDGFALTLNAGVGYHNNEYSEMKGWSDAVASAAISKTYKDIDFASAFYYGRTLGGDFKEENEGKKNHFWCDFGVNYNF